jgi:hypothetical protein
MDKDWAVACFFRVRERSLRKSESLIKKTYGRH